MRNDAIRIVCPSRHLGFLPADERSFREGAASKPDYYCCHSGSAPNEAAALGMDTSVSLYQWQKHDLELMLLASRQQGVPMLIGSAGDTGADSRVDLYVDLLQHLARKHDLPPFKLSYFYSELSKDSLLDLLEDNGFLEARSALPPLNAIEIDRTERILAVAQAAPFLQALQAGADVIVGGRSEAEASFAAAAMHEGFSAQMSYALGRAIHTRSALEPSPSANETLIGLLDGEYLEVNAIREGKVQRFLRRERKAPGDEISSSLHENIALEGCGKVGERFIAMLRLNESIATRDVDGMFERIRRDIAEQFSSDRYCLRYKLYEKSLSFGGGDELKSPRDSDRGVLIEGIAETEQLAEELTVMAGRLSQSTAGLGMQGVFPAPPVYRWTLQHGLPREKASDLFTLHDLLVT